MSSNDSNGNNNNVWTSFFNQFNQTIHAEGEKLFKKIVESQTDLINECENLRREIALLQKEKEEMSQLLKKYDQIVTLNIGGQLFSTTIDTLTKETCLFTKMFSGRIQLPEHQGATFIDRDPTHFRILLNYLRTNTFIEPQSAQERVELLLEAEYYQITSLVQRLQYETETETETETTIDTTMVVEKLLFDSNQHHPKVVISDNGLKASHNTGCTKCLYAKVRNHSWQTGRHYWEIIMETTKNCYASIGVATSSWNEDKRLGEDAYSWTLRLYGPYRNLEFHGLRHDGQSQSYHNEFSAGTRVGVMLDLDVGTLEYVIDGIPKGIAFANLKGCHVTPVFELCHHTIFRMNHDAITPVL